MWEKKWDFFHCLTFVLQSLICGFGKIFRKKSSKMNHIVGIIWWSKKSRKKKLFCSKFCASKPFQRDIAGKHFKVLIINARGEKVHKGVGISKPSICNSFWNWCQKLRKMMDIDASRECSIFVPKLSERLNWLFQLIYFLVVVSIFGFQRMRSQNLT